MSPADREARAWLTRVVEPGQTAVHALLERLGADALVRILRAGDVPRGIRGATSERMAAADADADLAAAAEHGIRFVVPGDPEWPESATEPFRAASSAGLERVAPPIGLWVSGSAHLPEVLERSVSVIGSRAFTSYGEHVATELAFGLAEQGWTVVSGGAYGIDGAAHRGALTAGGTTVAVLAGGLDQPYPAGHRELFERIRGSGALISEWPVGSTPQRYRFLVRNRLIAGMSAGTVVVEAAARSGTSSTAAHVERLGRALMAVPGPVTSALSAGTHALLRRDARLVTGVEDVLELVGPLGSGAAPEVRGRRDPRDGLDDLGRSVLDGVPARGHAPPEQIARESGLPVADVLRVLPALELHGFVEPYRDGWRLSTGLGRE